MWFWFVIRCLVFVELVAAEKECSESEVKYISTECAPDGSHFIIKFPKNPSVCVVTEAPKLMKDCTQKCPVGQALNLTSNICEDCPVGTSAPGDVYEVNYWSVLPKGFYSDVFHSSSKQSCSSFGWKPQVSYLLGTSNSYCATELTLENHNIEEGLVTFQYQFNDPFLMAYFTVRNDRCVLDGGKSYILPPSSRRKWKSYTAHVPAGVSTLQWYLFPENVYDSWTVTTEFKLKSVKVTGRVSTIHCSECEPGFYANHTKSSDCEICPRNTFSGRRASSCTDCPPDEYSLPGSSSCTKRLPCVDTEYTTTYSSCSADTNMHHLTTELTQPVICEANSPTASANPRGPEEKCSPCPPGTKTLNGTHCVSCPTGFISANHNDSCVACPADEVPVFGIKYDNWSRMPPRLATYCLEEDVTCQPWRTNGSSIFVGPGLSSFVHSVLELELLDGFIGPKLNMPFYLDPFIRPLPGTKVVFDFELDCRANCTLTFAVDLLSETLLIQKWNGPLKRMTYTYTPGECEGASFLWLFERWSASGSKWDPASRNDKAIIYSIAVNNTRGTGALGCKKCPLGIDGQFCKPCKDGLFYTMTKNVTTGVERAECVPCPNGTMVIGDASDIMTVDQACIRCPPGTTAGPASDCVTDLYPEAPSGQNYDFSTLLTKQFAVNGSKLFTPQGHAFQQHFKLYLDTRFPSQRPTCINDNKQDKNITAWICRMTSSPEKSKLSDSESSFRSASLGLGDKLIKAVATNSSKEFAKEINAKLTTAGWKSDDLGNDYHLFFKTKSTTSACQGGINSIVTLRCGAVSNAARDSVDASDTALVQIPPNCAVGTCDGCQFHFMVISPLACPICRMQDYNRIEGSCVGGSMKVTLIPPKTCRSEPKFRTVFEESCPLLNTQGKIAVGVVMAIVLLLIFTIFYCYQRNKKLEYKYMKLVEGAEARVKSSFGSSSNGSDGMQQSNECGIPEDDQETDIFHHKPISAIAGGESDSKWNQLTPNSGDLKSGTFGPVIFRNRTADDSHILTLDDGNAPDTVPI